MPLMTLENVEVFKAGDYGERGKYSNADLKKMAATFDPEFLEPPMTIDHEWYGPALGWVSGLRAKGSRLFADFKDIPEEIFAALRDKRFKKRSVEIYPADSRIGQAKGGPVIRAITWLGAGEPAVKGMKDVFASDDRLRAISFSEEAQDSTRISYEFDIDANDSGDLETKINTIVAEAVKKAVGQFSKGSNDPMPEPKKTDDPKGKGEELTAEAFAELQKKNDLLEAREKEREDRLRAIEEERFSEKYEHAVSTALDTSITEGRIPPEAQKPVSDFGEKLVTAVQKLHRFSDDKEGKVEALGLIGSFENLLANWPKLIEMGPGGRQTAKQRAKGMSDHARGEGDPEAESRKIDRWAQDYSASHKVDYNEALDIVTAPGYAPESK